jgi:DNA-binding LacI/PurR family transcriptional regulator
MGAPTRIKNATVLRLAAESNRDPRTVRRAIAGDPKVSENSREAIIKAAAQLGVELPDPTKP